ncbi:restriction endonuclease subunit S [Piscinibacter defluvii]|uniref:restriction endonuclease subunit S n=1 Tax=Piscinibacter defluvii TaxID=1796922 RepID=UPI000FDF3AEE|nr:restriction endonuclease subunit S [Piscinibacter defluvii]
MTAELPPGWAQAKLDEITLINPPGASTTVPDSQEVTFVPMAAVEPLTGHIDVSGTRTFGEVKKGFTRFRNGDVLFAKITPCMENGKIAVARGLHEGVGCGSTEFHVLRPNGAALPGYLRYYLVQSSFRRDAQRNMQGAVGQQRVPTDYLREVAVPVAPLAEQKRIVSRIEELFSEIDEGERALERTQELLKRYRQSVLKAAITGALTAAWRHARSSSDEPGEALLERMSGSTRHRRVKGDVQARPDDLTSLPILPDGWIWARAEAVCDFITKGTTPLASAMHSEPVGVPFIKVYNLTFDGSLDFTIDPTFVDAATHSNALSRSKLLPGDVVMNIVGPPLGKVSIVPDTHREWNMNQAVAVFRPLDGLDRHFLAYYLLSRVAQDWLASKSKATVGQVNLTLEICRDLPVPIPPPAEQHEIVQLAATELARLDNLASSLVVETGRGKSLRQSVLQAAFSGQLVPQDPTDEPASALLARLAAVGRGGTSAAPRRRGRPFERAASNRRIESAG